MGGIGKSEIAKGYAQTYRSEYDTILFTSYTSGLLDLDKYFGEKNPLTVRIREKADSLR